MIRFFLTDAYLTQVILNYVSATNFNGLGARKEILELCRKTTL